jgi:hypothetical protein
MEERCTEMHQAAPSCTELHQTFPTFCRKELTWFAFFFLTPSTQETLLLSGSPLFALRVRAHAHPTPAFWGAGSDYSGSHETDRKPYALVTVTPMKKSEQNY